MIFRFCKKKIQPLSFLQNAESMHESDKFCAFLFLSFFFFLGFCSFTGCFPAFLVNENVLHACTRQAYSHRLWSHKSERQRKHLAQLLKHIRNRPIFIEQFLDSLHTIVPKETRSGITQHTKWMLPKIGVYTPKSSILIGFSIINRPFWGTPIFGNPQIDPNLGKPRIHMNSPTEGHLEDSLVGCRVLRRNPVVRGPPGVFFQRSSGFQRNEERQRKSMTK